MRVRTRRLKASPTVVETSARERQEAADKVAQFVDSARSPRTLSAQRPSRRSKGMVELASSMSEAVNRIESCEWDGSTGRTFVGLFLYCHRSVYQFVPAELESTPLFRSVCKRAELCYRKHFRDDPYQCVAFIKWAWLRERKRMEWARREGREARRLRATLLFSDGFVDDYRVHLQGGASRGVKRSQTA